MNETLDLARHGLRMAPYLKYMLPNAAVNPARLLARRAEKDGDQLALAYLDERYTWRQVARNARRYALWYRAQGIASGDVVAIVIENRPDYLFALMGLNQIGAVASLINTNLTGKALSHALRVCSAKRVLAGEERLQSVLEVADELPDIDLEKDLYVKLDAGESSLRGRRVIDDELAAIDVDSSGPDPAGSYRPKNSDVYCYIYTSGTTGLPKAAIIRNQRMLAANVSFGHLMHRAVPGDVIYVTLPLYHSSAMFLGWGAALASGAAVALRRKFSASEFWEDVVRYRATSFLYIGELCRYLLNRPPVDAERQHRLRVGVGNGMRPDIWEEFQERFGVPVIREFYGSTEGNSPAMNFQGKPGMIGKLVPNQVIVRCDLVTGEPIRNAEGWCEKVEPGEVGLMVGKISKVLSFDGYVDKKATDKKIINDVFVKGDRYFDTGDLLQLHADKWLSFADRAGDTFRWKGENVSTNEVAEILSGAEGVSEANVYGVQVPRSEGRAGMVALQTAEGFDLDAFAAYAGQHLASYQRPLFLRVLTGGMRITSTFKHQKVEYRDEAYDRSRVADPLYVLVEGRYQELDDSRLAALESGELIPG